MSNNICTMMMTVSLLASLAVTFPTPPGRKLLKPVQSSGNTFVYSKGRIDPLLLVKELGRERFLLRIIQSVMGGGQFS